MADIMQIQPLSVNWKLNILEAINLAVEVWDCITTKYNFPLLAENWYTSSKLIDQVLDNMINFSLI